MGPGTEDSVDEVAKNNASHELRAGKLPLAKRARRLFAFFLDGALQTATLAPFLGTPLPSDWAQYGDPRFAMWGTWQANVSFALLGVFAAVQALLITRRGQSVGKLLLDLRIQRPDGSLPGFKRGVLMRSWLFSLVQTALPFVFIVDASWIFRPERRCLHDLAADTVVVRLPPEP